MNEKEMFKKFSEIIVTATKQGKTYTIILNPIQITTLHGAVALTMKHPIVKKHLQDAQAILAELRKTLCSLMVKMGFTQEEVEWLDKREA